MKGDFSRMTFDPAKHFLRVLMQQGRVQLDADWNEQTAILLHYLQTVVKDVIGPYAGPKNEDDYGFKITGGSIKNFKIGKGRYYVDGILVENGQEVWYRNKEDDISQPDLPGDVELADGNYLVYLDVWERHITYIQDDDIREKALGGPDTTTRTKVVWQVKVLKLNTSFEYCNDGANMLNQQLALSKVCLSARAKQEKISTEPCLILPDSRYRRAENQLYRVEIHSVSNGKPTFKWSRDNGSIVFPVKNIVTDSSSAMIYVELEHLGRDSDKSLSEGDWVEIVDDDLILRNETKPLLQVYSFDRVEMKVTLTGIDDHEVFSYDPNKHPLIRRWDHKKTGEVALQDGAIPISIDSDKDPEWIILENGIEISFEIKAEDSLRIRSGDYWLIPARTATGDVEWPNYMNTAGDMIPKPLPPQGVLHHFAPLAIINVVGGNVTSQHDCRCNFAPLSDDCDHNVYGRLGIGTDLLCTQEETS